jgi:thymidylate kinase
MRPGLRVLLGGPDGAGKSSLAAAVGLDRRHKLVVHWRPGVLPRPGSLFGDGAAAPVTNPHAFDPHGPVISAMRLVYFLTDFWAGESWRVRPAERRGCLVVIERGWWDMAVDPRRYRLSVPPGLVLAIGRLIPKPDLLLVLDAPAEVLASRKQELPTEELDRQRRVWLDLTIPGAEKVVLDATKPLDKVVADAREVIVAHLERRDVARLGAGWANLPGRVAPRWWLPRGPRSTAFTGISIYQPVTLRGRLGWEAARALARVGEFRLLRRGEAPPREVRVRLAPHLPPGTTYAVMRANHEGRYVALLVDEDGRAGAVAKVATTPEGEEALRREARAIAAWGGLLRPPVRAPRVLTEGDGVLLLEAVAFRPRPRPWLLPVAVARVIGALEREGVSHGDFAPWNLLEKEGGFVVVDWESAGPVPAPVWDLCHWLVQAHALLGRPHTDQLFAAIEGRGPLGEAVRGYLEEAGVPLDGLPRLFREHVERTRGALDPQTEDGARGLAARDALLRELGRLGGGVT